MSARGSHDDRLSTRSWSGLRVASGYPLGVPYEPMALMCLCYGVSERKVAKAIDRGARTVEEVGDELMAGRCCGGCTETISEMLVVRRRSTMAVA
jgi:bacterioferritin-associated ferredoxin